ncbi:MAG: SPASM domain-containing protein [Clostridia bacterium]|nr:SPASM domain-containing protein [Clostridia bacterium]
MKYSRAYVEITNICNKNCSFCPKNNRPKRKMTEEEFTVIAKKLRGVTDYLYYHVMGEPLTHPQLCSFIKTANEMGFKSAVTTNGSLLREKGDGLIESGVYKVNISVHSFEDGTKEDYLSYINDCIDFADKASKNGILTVMRLWNNGHDGGLNDETLLLMKEKLIGEWKEGTRGYRIRNKLHLEYGERFDWPDMTADNYGNDVFCYGLKDHFGVLCDGTVIPCCLDHEGDISLGNIFSENIEDILSGKRATDMRDGFSRRCATEELCRRCGYARRFK